ncbi:MAG: glycosyltransferase family 2 protein [Chlamydiales bacterium]|nr:glycosyltransferase family 2 protein [Chlamydiales bacterium]
MTKLSIIVPNFNHAPYLGETLDSILNQDFKDFELLVGDDASTDNSVEVIKAYGSRIRPFFFKKNRGYFSVVDDLVPEAKGEFLHIFSSDDIYMPGFLSSCMELLEREKLKLVCTNIGYFNSESERTTNLLPIARVFHKEQIVEAFRNTDFWIPGVACIVAKESYIKYGPHNPELENLCDWYLFHHIALFEGVGFLPQVGVKMREQESSYTATVKRSRKRRNATYWALLRDVVKDRKRRKLFRDSTVLSYIFDNLFWKLIWRPQWWDFFYASRKKSPISRRFTKSIKKRLHAT